MAPKRSTKLSLRKLVYQMGAGASVVALLAAVPVEMNRVGTKAKTKTTIGQGPPDTELFLSKEKVCDLGATELTNVQDINMDTYIKEGVKKPEVFAPRYRPGWADCKEGSPKSWRWEYFTIDLLLTASVPENTADTSAEFLMQWQTLQQILPIMHGVPKGDDLRDLEKMIWYGAGFEPSNTPPLVTLEDGLALQINFHNSVSGALNLRLIGKWNTGNTTKSFDMEAVASKVIGIMTTVDMNVDQVKQAAFNVAKNVVPYDQVGGGSPWDAVTAVDLLLHGGYHSMPDRKMELAKLLKDHSPLEQLWSNLMKQRLRLVAMGMGNILEVDFAKFVGRFVSGMELKSEAADEKVYWPVATEIARMEQPVYIAAQTEFRKTAAIGFPLDRNNFTPKKRVLLEYLTPMLRKVGIAVFCFARDSWGFNDFDHGYARGPDSTAVLTCESLVGYSFNGGTAAMDYEAHLHNSFAAMIVGMEFLESDDAMKAKFMKAWQDFKDEHMPTAGEHVSKAEHRSEDSTRLSNLDHVVLTRIFDGTRKFDGWSDHLKSVKDEEVLAQCRDLVKELLLPTDPSTRVPLTVKISQKLENPFEPITLTLDSINQVKQGGSYPDVPQIQDIINKYNKQLQTERDRAGKEHMYAYKFETADLNGALRKELLKGTKGYYHSRRINSDAIGVEPQDSQIRIDPATEKSDVVGELRRQMAERDRKMEELEKEKKELEDNLANNQVPEGPRGGPHRDPAEIAQEFWNQYYDDLGMDIWAIFLLFLSILCIFCALSMACATRAASRGQQHFMRFNAPTMSRTTMGMTLLLVFAGITFLWMSYSHTAARRAVPKVLTQVIMACVALLGASIGTWSALNMWKASSGNTLGGDVGNGIQLGERFAGDVSAW